MIHSYSTIYALGHKALAELLDGPVAIQEKVDGSQFSFQLGEDGELRCRSKGAQLNLVAPEPMFARAIETATALNREGCLVIGWTYRAEYLQKAHHNALGYDRVPNRHLILFDIDAGEQDYFNPSALALIAQSMGLEAVPLVYYGEVHDISVFRSFLDRESVLGGQKIEGLVLKNYSRYGPDKKTLMGKFVSEAYKEVHAKEWKSANPYQKDVLQRLIEAYRTPARWQKAIIHLRERGEIEDSPRDIGRLILEASADMEKECRDEIANALYQWAWPQIRRGATAGIAEWYKDLLLEKQFSSRLPDRQEDAGDPDKTILPDPIGHFRSVVGFPDHNVARS